MLHRITCSVVLLGVLGVLAPPVAQGQLAARLSPASDAHCLGRGYAVLVQAISPRQR